jgi:hypothetical protein
MPVTNWQSTTIDGKEWLVIDAKVRVPLDWDPSSNVFIAIAAPTGGVLNYPVLVQGDPGDTPSLDTTINFTALEWDDATPEFASWTETSPDVYRLNLGLRNGEPGATGAVALLDSTDLSGTPTADKLIAVNDSATGVEFVTMKVGNRYYPTAYNNTPSGNPAYTLTQVGIEAVDYDRTVEPHAACIVAGTSSDVRVDLYARLNGETGGNIVGRAMGGTGVAPATHTMIPRLPAGASADYDLIPAGETATVHLRAERQTGTGTFTTSGTDTDFYVKVNPVP